nr:hypothetical protein [Candidatus Baldrarchaeota archaeon]
MKLILDSSVLIAFYTELGRPELLHLLKDFGYDLLIPRGVFREVSLDPSFDRIQNDIRDKLVLLNELTGREIGELKSRYISLGLGELEVIWWGKHFKGRNEDYVCALDDLKARKIAKKLELNIIGTLGIIKLLNKFGVISKDELFKLYKTLKAKGFRLPDKF